MKGYHRHVSKNTGKNPVAQAVAKNALAMAITDQKIAIYLLTDGERCADLLAGIAGVLQVVQIACQLEDKAGVDVSILKGGLNACLQVMLADRYDTLQTTAIVAGLDKALVLAERAKPASINAAWHAYSRRGGA